MMDCDAGLLFDGRQRMLGTGVKPLSHQIGTQATDRSGDTSHVLDDDDFESRMAAIIERDYFPDIKPLQNKLEWTLASDSGDPEHISNAQRNIMLRRAGYSVRSICSSLKL
jgi:hypothetical protein